MSAAAAAATPSSPLRFTRSESKPVGFSGSMMDTVRDNAPRIVGALKLIGDVTAALTLNPYMMAYAAFSITGRVILLAFGSKKNQQAVAEKHAKTGETFEARRSWTDDIQKVLHPREYPVEAMAGLSTIGEMFEAAYGATELAAGRPGVTPLIVGIVAVGAYANILFGKETKQSESAAQAQSLKFGQSESKRVGVIGQWKEKLKGNPVMVSSLVGLGICAGLLVGSLMEGMNATYIAYAVVATIANITQALLIRKNDFNIEGAQDEAKQTAAQTNFQERVTRQRGAESGGVQPA